MNLDQRVVTRVGYTVLDVLSDLGGIQRVLFTFFNIVTAIFNFRHFETYLASRLYKVGALANESTYFKSSERKNLKELCLFYTPKRLICCCKRNKRAKAIEKALESMEKEIDIIEMIRQRRFVMEAIKCLLDP